MSVVQNLLFPSVADSGAVQPNNGTASKLDLGVDKVQFLKLLVAQLEHQDPLSPMQGQDFLAQLATFSSLEQLIDINKAVSRIAGSDLQGAGGGTGDSVQTNPSS